MLWYVFMCLYVICCDMCLYVMCLCVYMWYVFLDVSRNNFCMAAPTGWIPVAQDVKGCVNMEINWLCVNVSGFHIAQILCQSNILGILAFHCKIFRIISYRNFVYFSLLSSGRGGCLEWTKIVNSWLLDVSLAALFVLRDLLYPTH